jgi:hypothetical protein
MYNSLTPWLLYVERSHSLTKPLCVLLHAVAGVASIKLRATFSGGSNDPFQTVSVTLPVDAACLTSVCANYTALPPTPPPNPTPPPPPPTGNSTKPVYPECWGARLLLNPCPVGKRYFYDKDCKPQSENLPTPTATTQRP